MTVYQVMRKSGVPTPDEAIKQEYITRALITAGNLKLAHRTAVSAVEKLGGCDHSGATGTKICICGLVDLLVELNEKVFGSDE